MPKKMLMTPSIKYSFLQEKTVQSPSQMAGLDMTIQCVGEGNHKLLEPF